MGAARLPMRRIREVLRLKYEGGLGHRAIARACGVGTGTVSEYVARALSAGLTWPLPAELDDSGLEARLFRTATQIPGRARPDCSGLHEELKRTGVTLLLLWTEYREVHPDGYGYSQFCEIYRRWAKKLRPSMRQVHRAGEKTFVDFSGKRPHLIDRKTGQEVPVELFVGVLGASSYTYAEATLTQQLPDWIDAHRRMTEYFGGSSEIWVPDQLRSAVRQPCRYEPGINRSYHELATHYGAVVIPARPRKPRDKAKVESAVLVTQRWILARLRNQAFFDLAELNEAILALLDEINGRPMQKLGKSRRELWEQLDRPALKALPTSRYELAEWKECRPNVDYHIDVEHHLYSVPYQLRNEDVEARYTTTVVEIFYKNNRVASHIRRYDRRPATIADHMPSSHRAHAEWTPSRLIHWARKSGPATGRVVEKILASRPHPEQGYRACLGLMRLGRRHGDDRLEAACERAEHLRSYSFRTVDNILSSKQDLLPLETDPPALTPTTAHDNIRGATYYAAPQEDKC